MGTFRQTLRKWRVRDTRWRKHPFSVIEVVVALSVLAAGIVGLAGAFSLAVQAGGNSLRLRQAATLAQNQLELAIAEFDPDRWESKSGTAGGGQVVCAVLRKV